MSTFVAIVETTRFSGSNDLMSKILGAAVGAATIAGPPLADIVVADGSHEREREEISAGDTPLDGWTMEPEGDGCIMPGTNPELIVRLQASG